MKFKKGFGGVQVTHSVLLPVTNTRRSLSVSLAHVTKIKYIKRLFDPPTEKKRVHSYSCVAFNYVHKESRHTHKKINDQIYRNDVTEFGISSMK